MNFHQFIYKFIEMGIAVMPLYHRSKEPMLASWREFQSRLPDTEYLSWFPTDWCNYGVICGWCNLVVIDFDNIEYYNIWKLHCNSMWVNIADIAFKVRTRQGMHVYLRTEQPSCNDKRISIKAGIDIQAQGKYVVGPLCTHRTGCIYAPIGEMIFPVVSSIEEILPLHLFPRVASDRTEFTGTPIPATNTEYLNADPFAFASMDLISKVKASVRIESLYAGVQRSSTDGRWLKALCPFHDDKKQSAWIDTQRQIAGCQVCAMKPMDCINVYARMHGINNSAAVTAMAAEVGVWK